MSLKSPNPSVSPAKLVLSNATDFLNAGLTLLFSPNVTSAEAKVAIISIQTAIELLVKYRLIRQFGLSSIVRGNVPEGPIEKASREGRLYTIGYSECLKRIQEEEAFSEAERKLVRGLQNLRNSLVHFTADIDVLDVRRDAASLLVRSLSMFAAGAERDDGQFQTHSRFLNDMNFQTLTNYEPYRLGAVDSARSSLDSDEVLRCWACGVDAMSFRPSDNYFCHCCGLTVLTVAVAYVDCGLCGVQSGAVYDPLNLTDGFHHGRCLHCGKELWIRSCPSCGSTRSFPMNEQPPGICEDCPA